MLVGLNPLVIVSVVNGGHNDALVGLSVLGAALLAERDKPAASGAVLALGALVKITALLALPALAVWLLVRHGRRSASTVAGVGVATVMLGYALAGPTALSALNANHRLMSRASVWQIAHTIAGLDNHTHLFHLTGDTWLAAFGLGAVALTGMLALLVAWWRRRDSELGVVVALAVTTYLVAGLYVLPWYGMWMLPAAALGRRRGPLVYAAVLAAFLTAIYAIRDRALPATVGTGWWWVGAYLGPMLLLLGFVYVLLDRGVDRAGAGKTMPPWRRRPPVPAPELTTADAS
jgi:alpha-1,6-mannosyltransferase